jgi:LPS sulfotransferase NodH
MSPKAPACQEFVILTHVRSGSSLLADLLARNGIGNAEEHLNQRVLVKADRDWDPEKVLNAARCEEQTGFFGSKVMIHWLEDLKRHARITAATNAQVLKRVFAPGFVTIHLYRGDTVAAAVSFTLAELSGRWHQVDGQTVGQSPKNGFRLPRWAAMEPLISDNLAWLDACKKQLRATAAELQPRMVEICYEDLAVDKTAQLRRAANAIPGAEGRSLSVPSGHAKLADGLSEELCLRWRASHPEYKPAARSCDRARQAGT